MRKVIEDLDDILNFKEDKEINEKEIRKAKQEREWRQYFNTLIAQYTKKNNVKSREITQKEVGDITRDYTPTQKQIFIQQLVKSIETNF